MHIYAIERAASGKQYIGSTSCADARRRWWQHLSHLRKGKHYNRKLQSAWDKYGSDSFRFIVLDSIVTKGSTYVDLLALEQKWLDRERPHYNLDRTAHRGRKGKPTPEITRQRMSDALSGSRHPNWGKKMSPEWIAKMRKAVTGIAKPTSGKRKAFRLRSPAGGRGQRDRYTQFLSRT